MFSLVLSLFITKSFAIINGGSVQPADYKDVVLLNASKKCAATLIGPRTLVTSAKCVGVDPKATFDLGGKTYQVQMTKSPDIGKLHDMALGLIDQKVEGVKFAYVGKAPVSGMQIKLLGFGCTVEGGGDSDLTLKGGNTKITGVSGFDFTSQETSGAVICPGGDEGGPAFAEESGKHWLVGINRTSNLRDKNYHIGLQAEESQRFLNSFQTSSQSPICGVSANCESDPVNPPECRLTASPSTIVKGSSLTLMLEILSGTVTSATLDNLPVTPPMQKVITPRDAGDFKATATVKGPTGENSCSANYRVDEKIDPNPQAPSCRLIASPKSIKPNGTVTLTLQTFGSVALAKIDDLAVSPQGGSKVLTGAQTAQKGIFTSAGLVVSPSGTAAACSTYYEVSTGDPLPNLPNFSVIGTLCGSNTLANSAITRVCIGTLKRDNSVGDLKVSEAIQLTYKNNTEEVMMVMGKINKPIFTSTVFEELWLLYSNKYLSTGSEFELDTRTVTASVDTADSSVKKLSGKSSKGELFIVENLTPAFTTRKP